MSTFLGSLSYPCTRERPSGKTQKHLGKKKLVCSEKKLVSPQIILAAWLVRFKSGIQFLLDNVSGMLIDEDIVDALRHLYVRFQSLVISREKEKKWRLYRTRNELGSDILMTKVSENKHIVILYTGKKRKRNLTTYMATTLQ